MSEIKLISTEASSGPANLAIGGNNNLSSNGNNIVIGADNNPQSRYTCYQETIIIGKSNHNTSELNRNSPYIIGSYNNLACIPNNAIIIGKCNKIIGSDGITIGNKNSNTHNSIIIGNELDSRYVNKVIISNIPSDALRQITFDAETVLMNGNLDSGYAHGILIENDALLIAAGSYLYKIKLAQLAGSASWVSKQPLDIVPPAPCSCGCSC